MQTHKLKCWPEIFEAFVECKKTFDIRFNDRDYQVGDIIKMREWNPDNKEHSGRGLDFKIVYITRGLFDQLKANMIVIQLEPIEGNVSLGFLPQNNHTIKMLMEQMEKYNIKKAFGMITHCGEAKQIAIDVFKIIETFREVDKPQDQIK